MIKEYLWAIKKKPLKIPKPRKKKSVNITGLALLSRPLLLASHVPHCTDAAWRVLMGNQCWSQPLSGSKVGGRAAPICHEVRRPCCWDFSSFRGVSWQQWSRLESSTKCNADSWGCMHGITGSRGRQARVGWMQGLLSTSPQRGHFLQIRGSQASLTLRTHCKKFSSNFLESG